MNTTTTVSGAHGKGDTLESSSLDKILANTQCADYVGMPLTLYPGFATCLVDKNRPGTPILTHAMASLLEDGPMM